MNFEQLKTRVERTEALVDGRIEQTETAWRTLRGRWRDSWTPLRIVLAGGISGFLVGKTQPLSALGKLGSKFGGQDGQRWIQLITSVSGLVTAVRVKSAAEDAEAAADDVQVAAQDVEAAADDVATTGGAPAGTPAGGGARPAPRMDAPAPPDVPTPRTHPSDARRVHDAAPASPTSAAEAATEISER